MTVHPRIRRTAAAAQRWLAAGRPQLRRAGGAGLVVLALAAATGGSVEAYQQREQADAIHQGNVRQQHVTACQVRFNNAYAAVTVLRGQLGDQDRAATKAFNDATAALITFVFTAPPGTTRAQVTVQYARYKTAAAAYQRTEARITQMRSAHPFPALPSAACE
jgi:hypothetical protein